MSGFKFESEFNIVSEAVKRFYDEYEEIQYQTEVHVLLANVRFTFITYSQLISKCMRRAKKLKPDKRKECLAYLKYIRKTDARMELHYNGVESVAISTSHLLGDVETCCSAVNDMWWWFKVSNSRNRRWVRRHWDEAVSDVKWGLETLELYKREYSTFAEEMRALQQLAEDRKAELKEEMVRHYGLSKL